MNEQTKILIIFTEKADLMLSSIIKKYALQETETEAFKKYKAGKLPKIVILDHLAGNFALKIISENDLVVSLQKELETTQQIAENISKDIINNLVPLLDKVSEDQLENYNLKKQPNSGSIVPSPKINENPPTILGKLETISPNPTTTKTKIIEAPRASKKIEKKLPEKNINIQKMGPDSYRESIE